MIQAIISTVILFQNANSMRVVHFFDITLNCFFIYRLFITDLDYIPYNMQERGTYYVRMMEKQVIMEHSLLLFIVTIKIVLILNVMDKTSITE